MRLFQMQILLDQTHNQVFIKYLSRYSDQISILCRLPHNINLPILRLFHEALVYKIKKRALGILRYFFIFGNTLKETIIK